MVVKGLLDSENPVVKAWSILTTKRVRPREQSTEASDESNFVQIKMAIFLNRGYQNNTMFV